MGKGSIYNCPYIGSVEMLLLLSSKTRKRKKIKDKYRKKIIDEFEELLHHCRHLVKTMFSALKRRYGEELKAKKYWNQAKEVKLKLLVITLTGMSRLHILFK